MAAGSGTEGATSFESVLGRLKESTNTSSDSEFAQKALGKGQSSVSNAKVRGIIPPQWIETVSKKYGISADWLFFGRGPMKRVDHPSEAVSASECARCQALESELRAERDMTRELMQENRQLWKENGDLRVEVAELKARAAPDPEAANEGDRNVA